MEGKRLSKQPKKKQATRSKRAVLALKRTAKPGRKTKPSWKRRAQQRVSYLFDQAVPEAILYRGIISKRRTQTNPSVRVSAEPNLSPFTIHLQPELPTPEDIIAEWESAPVRLNLLVPEAELLSADERLAEIRNALTLAKEELLSQLTEDDQTAVATEPMRINFPRAVPVPKFDLDLRPALPTWKAVREALLAFRKAEPTRPTIADGLRIEEILPAEDDIEPLAEDTATQQDADTVFALDLILPEAEDAAEEESDLVTFEDIAAELEKKEGCDRKQWNNLFAFKLPQGWQRGLAAFVLFSFAFVLPLQAVGALQELRTTKNNIEASGLAGLAGLESGASAFLSKNALDASANFAAAHRAFGTAQESLDGLGGAVNLLLSALPESHDNYALGKKLVDIGEDLSLAGQRLSEGFLAIDHEAATTLTSKISILAAYIESALPSLEHAADVLKAIDRDDIPEDRRPLFDEIRGGIDGLNSSLGGVLSFSETLLPILGEDGQKRYLLVFQNNTELRPTGGFMGSFALIDVKDGEIVGLDIPEGGTYDLQGSLLTSRIAPEPLWLLSARWEFQDANWFADFPTSARQILEFYEDSGGPSVDGVIAVNATLVSSLLEVMGPVPMPAYDRVIDSENFIFETQKIVEMEFAAYEDPARARDEPAPKAFIGDLAVEILGELKEASLETFLGALDLMNQGLAVKDIQLYFTDNDMQRTARERNWDGRVKTALGDYLMVVDTNLGGGKTDGVISETVKVDVSIAEDGSIVNTVIVERLHRGMSQELFTGVNNVDYLRLYVPQGSTLISASGFSIPDALLFEEPDPAWLEDEDVRDVEAYADVDPASGTTIADEFGKTVFGNWVQTKPGATSTATFTYRLPFTVETLAADPGFFQKIKASLGWRTTDNYTITIQKQSGVLDRTTNVTVHAPDSLTPLWTSSADGNASFTNDTDAFFAILFERDV